MKQRILKVFEKVFGENANEVFFNGFRAEGCSIIIIGEVWSYMVEKLIEVINEDLADKFDSPLAEWRVRKGTPLTIVNKEVPEDLRDDCYEVRLICKGHYRH